MLNRRARERGSVCSSIALGVALGLGAASVAHAEGWSDRIEIHGFFNSTARAISPQLDLGREIQLGAWQQRLNLETTMDIFENDDWSVSGRMVLTPTYDLVYDLYPTVYGKRAQSGAFGTQLAQAGFSRNPDAFRHGESAPGAGDGIEGAFRYINQDIAFVFTGNNAPGLVIDDVVFFGQTVAPASPRSSNQVELGGPATLSKLFRGPAIAQTALQGSFALATQPAGTGLRSPAQITGGAAPLGDRRSFQTSPFGINRTEGQLRTNCFDNANPWCFMRELYLDVEHGDTFVRVGKQQIVWGKTDAFRMQDIINPLEISDANIFTPLEERRIPQWAVDVVHSFGDVGPVQDLSLELVWVVDRFLPTQLGQCGEPRAFLATCAARANAAAHGLFGLALAESDERNWQLRNTEPGFRVEGRFADPAVSWSFSGFWGFQDTPVTKLSNGYSFTNANPGAVLFLQGLGVPAQLQAGPLAGLTALTPTFVNGFDPYSLASINTVAGELRTLYGALFGAGGVVCNASTAASPQAHADCISASQLQLLALPFSGGQIVLEYPRTLTLGGSVDYQIPGADAIVNLEMAFDFDRKIISTAEADLVDSSNVISAAVGIDWSPFIPWVNRSRTSLVGAQFFVEHILDHTDRGQGRRMIPDETQVISTLFMQNYWRNDSLILTNFLAWDWNAQALAWGPTLKWILSESVFVEVGAQMIWSKPQKRSLRNACVGGDLTVACISDPANFQAGNFQSLNEGFARTAQGPLFTAQSFGDSLEEDRDTIFLSVTYQF